MTRFSRGNRGNAKFFGREARTSNRPKAMRRRHSLGLEFRSTRYEPLEERIMLDIGGANPPSFVVGRTLSAYDLPDVQNNQETITLTVYNQAAEPISGVLLTDTLKPGVTFAGASQLPDQNGEQLAWSLGTIQPFDRASVTLTVSLANPTPTTLDMGASAYGTLDAGLVNWTTAPATLRTTAIAANLLASTPDANTTDPYVQEKAAELNYDPTQIYSFLQNDIGYNSYTGSLRGARGTLWSNAGNSLDDASLGIALMRASGIPAQYEEGTLSTAQAQQLILSMFPASYQTVGYIPSGTATADPANDPKLLSETKDHYWFQFDSGSGMKDADPEFANLTIGQAAATATNSFAEVPDALRAKTEISLTAEMFNQGSALLGLSDGLGDDVVLDQTFNDVDLVGKPISIAHFINQTGAGSIFSATTTTYSPYLAIGDDALSPTAGQLIHGKDYQEVVTNFPFSSQILTGLFLNMTLTGPGATPTTLQRTLFDRIGYAARQGDAPVSVTAGAGSAPALGPADVFTVSVLPGLQDRSGEKKLDDEIGLAVNQAQAAAAANPSGPGVFAQATEAAIALTRLQAMSFQGVSDTVNGSLAQTMMVKAYFDTPRVTIVSARTVADPTANTQTFETSLDLRSDHIRSIPFPGQSPTAGYSFQVGYGVTEGELEQHLFGDVNPASGVQTVSTSAVFTAAAQQNIPLTVIKSDNLSTLSAMDISLEAKARITTAVQAGLSVMVPTRSVQLNGSPAIAWYEIDPDTGETTAVTEDGGHQVVELTVGILVVAALITITAYGLPGISFSKLQMDASDCLNTNGTLNGKGVQAVIDCLNGVEKQLKDHDFGNGLVNAVGKVFGIAYLEYTKAFAKDLAKGIGKGGKGDPPLSQFLLNGALPPLPTAVQATATESVGANVAAGAVTGTAQTSRLSVSNVVAASWDSTDTTGLRIDSLTAANATVMDSHGNVVGAGNIALTATQPLDTSVSGTAHYAVNGQGSLSFYGPAETQLGVSGDWGTYTASVTGNVTLQLSADNLMLNGAALPAGSYSIVAPSATLQGSGLTSSPSFAGSASLTSTNGVVQLGPAAGAVSLGGAPLAIVNGATLTGYTGTLAVGANGGADSVTLNGSAANGLSLSPSPAAITTDQNTPVTFQVGVHSSLTDTYNLTATAPAGWSVAIDSTGLVTVTPAAGTQGGVYAIRVTAQSQSNADLIAAATVMVTLTPTTPGMTLSVVSDTFFSVPFGGAQLPTAFRVEVTNTGPAADTYHLTFPSVPPGFTLLDSQTTITVPAGQTGVAGIYLQPTGGQLPAPGTNASFSVTATSVTTPAITHTVNQSFTMPAVDAVTLTSNPASVASTPGVGTTVTLTLNNAGNLPETVTLTATAPGTVTVSGLATQTLAVGQSVNETLTFTPAATATLNSTLATTITATYGPAGNTQTATTEVDLLVRSAQTVAISQASVDAGSAGNAQLAGTLSELSDAISLLQTTPTDASLLSRIKLLLNILSTELSADPALAPLIPQLAPIEADADSGDVTDMLAALTAFFNNLNAVLAVEAAEQFTVSITPDEVDLPALANQQKNLSVMLTDTGLDPVTLTLSTGTLPGGVTATLGQSQITLQPGASQTVSLSLTSNLLSTKIFTLDVHAVDSTDSALATIAHDGAAVVAVRAAAADVLSVTVTPITVDAGMPVAISASIFNTANATRNVLAHIDILNAANVVVASPADVPISLLPSASAVSFDLGAIDTSTLISGVYTAKVSLRAGDGSTLPGKTSEAPFLVGLPISAQVSASPTTLPPGNSNVTTTITVSNSTTTVHAPVGDIVAFYSADNPYGISNTADGAVFVIENTSAVNIINGVFTITPIGGPVDSFKVGLVPAAGHVIIEPGISDDGQTGHTFFNVTGTLLDESESGPNDDDTRFEFTGQQGSTVIDSGVFTPSATRSPSESDPNYVLSFLGGPGDHDAPTLDFLPKVVATLYDPPSAPSGGTFSPQNATPPISGGNATPQGQAVPPLNAGAMIVPAVIPTPPSFNPPAGDALKWIGAASGNWNVAANWLDTTTNTNHVPDATDNVTIDAAGLTITVNTAGEVAQSLLVKSSTTLAITAGTLAVASGTESDGTLTLANATFRAGGGLVNDVSVQWTCGTLDLQGADAFNMSTMTVSNSVTLASTNGSNTFNLGGRLINEGTIVEQAGSLAVRDGIEIDNTALGTWQFTDDATIFAGSFSPTAVNNGIFQKTGGAGNSDIQLPLTSVDGTFESDSGVLRLTDSDDTFTGGVFNAGAGATVNISSGTTGMVFSGTFTGTGAGAVLLNGGTIDIGAGGATFNFAPGLFQWVNATINLQGNSLTNLGAMSLGLANQGTGEAMLSRDAGLNPLAATFTNQGALTELGSTTLSLFDQVQMSNTATGSLLFAGDGDLAAGGQTPSFTSAGTIEKTSGVDISQIRVNFTYTGGPIKVDTGTLMFDTLGGQFVGTSFTVAAGATLDLTGNTNGNVLSGTFTGTGGGTVLLPNGSIVVGQSGVTFNFPAGMFHWTGGGINLEGHTLTNTGSMTLANPNNVSLFGNDSFSGNNQNNLGGTFNNSADLTASATGSLALFDSVAFHNLAGATLSLAGDSDLLSGNFSPTLTNAGTIEKTAGNGTSTISAPFSNLGGTLKVDSGTLALAAPTGESTGAVINVAAGATLDLTGNTDGNVYSGTFSGTGAGTVLLRNGDFEIGAAGATFNFPAGMFQWTGGGINLFGHTLTNVGVMALANANNVPLYGNGNFNGGPNTGDNLGGTLDNQGTINDQGPASMQLFDSVVLKNEAGATINLTGGAGLLFGNFSSSIDNLGAIRVTNGAATSTISAPLTNTGAIDVVSGELDLTSTLVNKGILDAHANTLKFTGAVQNGNVIQTEGGTLAFDESNNQSVAVDNTGAIVVNGGSAAFTGPVTQANSGFLTGGDWQALGGGSISLPAGGNIKFNEAKIALAGAGAAINGIQPLASNDGSFSITGGATFTTTDDFTDNGPLTIGPDSVLSVAGDYAQTAAATLDVQLGGTPASGHFGRLTASGAATFGGLLRSELVSGYTPSVGDNFTVGAYASTSGNFAAVELAETPTVAYAANLGATTLVLISQAATLAATQTTLTSSAPSGASFGELVQYTATVTAPGGGTPTGAVQFQIDGLNSGTPVVLSGVQATLTIALPAGSHTIAAFYISGSTQFANSDNAAAPLIQRVNAINAPASTVELYYTTFSPGTVDKVSVTFDQNGLTLGGPVPIVQNIAADGLIFLPNGDLLTANGTASEIDPNTGAVTSVNGQGAEHLALDPSGTKVWTSPQPGSLVEIPLNPLADGIVHTLSGDDTTVTHLAFDPAGQAYYVSSSPGGFGSFGLIDLTTFTTKRIFSNLPAAHGISYDPYTGDLFLVGALSIVQIDPRTLSIVSERDFPTLGSVFDQGANDGKGHIYVANNGGYLAFIDYSGTGLVGDPSDFVATPFLANALDDVAPLAGLGGAGIPVAVDHHLTPAGYNVNPTSIAPNPASFSSSDVTWNTTFTPGQAETDQFQLSGQVTNMAPGEVRQISQGTTVTAAVTAQDGTQIPVSIQLPPLVVAAEHIIELAPPTDTIDQGATATYTVDLSNPLPTDEVYSLSIDGLPAGEIAALAQSVNVPAGGTVQVPLTIHVPFGAVQGTQGFIVSTQTDAGASDSVEGQLTVTSRLVFSTLAVHLNLTPAQAVAGQTNPAVYTLTLTNTGDTTDTYSLAASLPTGFTGAFSQTTITVPPGIGNFRDVQLTLTPPAGAAAQDYPFTVTAKSTTDARVQSQANGAATVVAVGVQVQLTPSSAVPGSTYQLKVTNTGQATDTFNLSLASPGALVSTLGTNQVTLPAGGSQTVPVTTGAINFASQGVVPLTGIATSQANSAVQSQSTADLTIVATPSMTAAFNPAQQTLAVPGATSFLLLIQNTGNTQDSYSATILGTSGQVSANLIGLDGQPTQSVPSFILPAFASGGILLQVNDLGSVPGTIIVLVQSLTNADVKAAPTATITVGGPTTLNLVNNTGLALAEGASATLNSTALEATDTDPSVTAANIVYKTTTAPVEGTLSLNGQPLASGGTFTQDDINHGRVAYKATEEGADSFGFTVTAAQATGISGTFLIATSDPAVVPTGGFTLSAVEGANSSVQTVATFTDPGEFEPQASYTAQIDWGDGSSSAGNIVLPVAGQAATVSGQHAYAEEGNYAVRVTLHHEGATNATVTSTAVVSDVALAASGGFTYSATEGAAASAETVAVFTDPAGPEALSDYSAQVDWGDGTSATAGSISIDPTTRIFTVSGQHAYSADGTYPIKVTLHHDATPDTSVNSSAQIGTVSGSGGAVIAATGVAVSGHEQSTLTSVTVAAFTAGDGSIPASDFSATIDWGDGVTSAGSVTLSSGNAGGTPSYTVAGSHDYLDEGNFTIHVAITNLLIVGPNGSSATVSATATMHEELLAEGTLGTANQRYIDEIYRDAFSRNAEPTGREIWVGFLAQGATREAVALTMLTHATSEEFQIDTVNALYEQYLHRSPDAGGMQTWVAYLYGGGTIEGMTAALLGSPEYLQTRGGGTSEGFLKAVFQDTLGRSIDGPALAFFEGLMAKGVSAGQVAAAILSSDEYHDVRVEAIYEQFLDRPATPTELATHAAELASGIRDEQIMTELISSDEYFAKAEL